MSKIKIAGQPPKTTQVGQLVPKPGVVPPKPASTPAPQSDGIVMAEKLDTSAPPNLPDTSTVGGKAEMADIKANAALDGSSGFQRLATTSAIKDVSGAVKSLDTKVNNISINVDKMPADTQAKLKPELDGIKNEIGILKAKPTATPDEVAALDKRITDLQLKMPSKLGTYGLPIGGTTILAVGAGVGLLWYIGTGAAGDDITEILSNPLVLIALVAIAGILIYMLIKGGRL